VVIVVVVVIVAEDDESGSTVVLVIVCDVDGSVVDGSVADDVPSVPVPSESLPPGQPVSTAMQGETRRTRRRMTSLRERARGAKLAQPV